MCTNWPSNYCTRKLNQRVGQIVKLTGAMEQLVAQLLHAPTLIWDVAIAPRGPG